MHSHVSLHRNDGRHTRSSSAAYWKSGPGQGVSIAGMKTPEAIEAWAPSLPPVRPVLHGGGVLVLKILEVCLSAAAKKEAIGNFGFALEWKCSPSMASPAQAQLA